MTDQSQRQRQHRGFATMSKEQRTEIARRGGRAVRAEHRSFSRNHDLAVAAGRKGGSAPKRSRAETTQA